MRPKERETVVAMLAAAGLALGMNGCGSSTAAPISVSLVPSATQVMAGGSPVTITATVPNDTTHSGVSWGISGVGCAGTACGSLSNQTSASATYTPPSAPPPSDFTVRITGTSVASPSTSGVIVITVPAIVVSLLPGPTTVVTGTSAALSAKVANDAANKGVKWTLACSAANCGAVSPANTTSGAATTYTAPSGITASLPVNITATSVADSTKSAPSTLTVVLPLTVATTSLTGAIGGVAYNQMLQATGGLAPFSWSLATGSTLPAGISLGADGTISGTPTAGGTFSLIVQVADSGNPQATASATLSLTVTILPLTVTSTTLPNGTVDTAYRQSLQATGGIPPYSWSISSGNLPTWASFTPQGSISGFPNAAATANFTVQVADSESPALTATQALAITVNTATGANDSELKGHYAFLFSGFDDATSSPIAVAGSFTADGAGNLTDGLEDLNEASGPSLNVPFTGTYSIGADNRGAFTINSSTGAKTYACAVGAINGGVASNGRFIEFDDASGTNGQRGSGILRLQDPTAFSLGSFVGPYAFGFVGQDSAGNRSAMVGSLIADGSGKVTSGLADQNVAGVATNPSLTGTMSAPSLSNGRGMLTLSPSSNNNLNLAAYVVSAGELLALTMDPLSSSGILSGSILSQKSVSFTNHSFNAPSVLYDTGYSKSGLRPVAEVGLLSPDGNGSLTMSLDENTNGSVLSYQSTNGTYSVASTGRVTVNNWAASASSPIHYLYLVGTNRAFLLSTGPEVGFGFVEPQAVAPSGGFTNATLQGTFLSGTLPPAGSSLPNASAQGTLDGTSKFSETVDSSTTSQLIIGQVTTGTYSVETNGRGTVTSLVTTTGMLPVLAFIFVGLFFIFALAPGWRRGPTLRPALRPAFALVILLAAILLSSAGCVIPKPQLIFYTISPTKIVVLSYPTATVAMFEQ